MDQFELIHCRNPHAVAPRPSWRYTELSQTLNKPHSLGRVTLSRRGSPDAQHSSVRPVGEGYRLAPNSASQEVRRCTLCGFDGCWSAPWLW